MKPAKLAWATALLAAGSAACGPVDPPPAAAPPTVMIATSPPAAEPPPPPPPDPPPTLRVALEPSAEGPAAVRDERRYGGRARALIVTEIQGLESLFASMPPSSPDRPLVMRRIAEEYVELAWSAVGDRSEKLTRASRAAIKYYQLLKAQYPKWCAAPNAADPLRSTGCGDEVLYHLGLEAERAGELDTARKAYLDLIQSFPQSRFIPHAYLAFGEIFMDEAAKDPSKLPLAEQTYLEVVKYPPPDNKVFGYAHYRLADVFVGKGDDPRALAELMKAATWAAGNKDGAVLGAAVRRKVVPVYARAGDPTKARAFFARFASGAELEEMLADLAQRRLVP